jgi:anti-sigma factor RsiW
MARLMSHDEAAELLGAYALDAVDPDEVAAIEAHLESCPRCRDELRNHREVTGLLAYAGQEAPAGLWDRVVSEVRAEETAPSGSRPPVIAAAEDHRRRNGGTGWRGWILQSYQLWGQSGQKLISYGLIGANPAPVTAFRVGRPVQALAISAEAAGGVVAPTQAPVVSGGVT